MKIWKQRAISMIAALGLGLAAPLVLAGCEQDEGFGENVEETGEEFGEQVDETADEFGDEFNE